MISDASKTKLIYVCHSISLLLYIAIAYFTPREDFIQFIFLYSSLFGLYIASYQITNESTFQFSLLSSLLFRFAIVFSIPNLSDDFYRFIWDGRLLLNGENPFSRVPSSFTADDISNVGLSQELYLKLNSPNYFTVYPPICQFVFWTSCRIFPESVYGSAVVMKTILFLFDVGSIFLISALLQGLGLSKQKTLLYALNPLVIIEFSGNAHFESAMIFFLILFFYLSNAHRFILSSLAFALAACSKLLPLLFLPLLFKKLGFVKMLLFSSLVGFFSILFFLPFLSIEMLGNITASLSLYVQTFEFNASIYYVIREVGFLIWGQNMIAYSGKLLTLFMLFGFLFISITDKVKSWIDSIFIALTLYFLCATTVHSWYLTTLVMLSVFVKWRFAFVWSAVAGLSYSAYSTFPYQENLWFVFAEYAVLYCFIGWEFKQAKEKALQMKE